MVKQIYLAGAMSGIKFEDADIWRKVVKEWIDNYKLGIKIINPNDYYNFLDDTTYDSEREIMDYDLWRVKHSDLVIVNFNVDKSIGTSKEIAIARESGIPVIGLNQDSIKLHTWDVCDCNKIFTNMHEMLEYVRDFYLDV